MFDLEEILLDLDDLLLLDLLLLGSIDFVGPTSALFSSASFNHLTTLCLKLNIFLSWPSNHWLSARKSSSVNKCWYSSFTAVSSFNMSMNCCISFATADPFINKYNIFNIPDFQTSLALIFSLFFFSAATTFIVTSFLSAFVTSYFRHWYVLLLLFQHPILIRLHCIDLHIPDYCHTLQVTLLTILNGHSTNQSNQRINKTQIWWVLCWIRSISNPL